MTDQIPPEFRPEFEITFNYLNYRGEIAKRRVIPDKLEWILKPGYGYTFGWFLSGWDRDKAARRSFALSNIVLNDESTELPQFFTLINFLKPKA